MWAEYLEFVKDEPSLTDFYLMQVSRSIDTQYMKPVDAKKIKIKDYLLKSENAKPKRKLTLSEKIAKASKDAKAFFGGLLGVKH